MSHTRKQQELIGLFRHKVERLGGLIKGGDIYVAIEAAGIIRDLLLSDTNGLYGIILSEIPEMKNKRNRKITFEVQFLGTTYHDRIQNSPLIVNVRDKVTICPHKEFKGR